jgi:hypothetical protein
MKMKMKMDVIRMDETLYSFNGFGIFFYFYLFFLFILNFFLVKRKVGKTPKHKL